MKLVTLYLTLLILCLTVVPAPAAGAAEARTALVIGNAGYAPVPLDNPVNDASDVAAALRGAGFEVMLRTDADRSDMQASIRDLGETLRQKGGVGLFYFAGHGMQLAGSSYILPVGARIKDERDIRDRAVDAATIVDAMAAAHNRLNILVLDACRDNGIGPSGTRGLSRIDSNERLFISYSTSPGAVALDGTGRNSPYSKQLAQAIGAPDLTIEETFKETLKGVYQETHGQQTPWISSSFFGDFIFRPGAGRVAEPPRFAPPHPWPVTRPMLAGLYRATGTNPDHSAYRGMVAVTQAGDALGFTWWIGRQVFTGNGQFAGRILVVNWGDKHPVLYSFSDRDSLDGEWADGTATEHLDLYASAAEGPTSPPAGRYHVTGRNPNGSAYEGAVDIVARPGRIEMDWKVGGSAYHGSGAVAGNLLTVNWGSVTPVVYAITADGSLKGLWDGGAGEEALSPER
jgi:hypothetical protein